MNFFYDANFSIGSFRGMGKYINNFVNVISEKEEAKVYPLLSTMNKNCTEGISFGFRNYFFWEQFSFLFFYYKNIFKNSFFIFPYNTAPIFILKRNNQALILHDLIFFDSYYSKSIRQRIGNLYRRIVLPKIIYKFKYIITVSEYSKSEICKRFLLTPHNVIVIPNSIKLLNVPTIDFEYKDNYFFHIGGEPSYKNTISVIKAYSLLEDSIKQKYQLLILGIRDKSSLKYFNSIVEELSLSCNIIFHNYLTDAEVQELYLRAKLFIFPSFKEGFGIPILEAYNYGCPLVCSYSSCFPEIAQGGALYFDPSSIIDIRDKITEAIYNIELTKIRINKGFEIVTGYSKDVFDQKVTSFLNSI